MITVLRGGGASSNCFQDFTQEVYLLGHDYTDYPGSCPDLSMQGACNGLSNWRFYFCFWPAACRSFQGQISNAHHSSDLRHSTVKTWSFNCQATRKLCGGACCCHLLLHLRHIAVPGPRTHTTAAATPDPLTHCAGPGIKLVPLQ